jgi:predicted DNA-binding antitoxin AbrB/MazE fold protein
MLIHGRYSKGAIELLEKVDFAEGEDVLVDVVRGGRSSTERMKYLEKSAGAWKGLVDAEQFKRDIYADRLIQTRKEVKL